MAEASLPAPFAGDEELSSFELPQLLRNSDDVIRTSSRNEIYFLRFKQRYLFDRRFAEYHWQVIFLLERHLSERKNILFVLLNVSEPLFSLRNTLHLAVLVPYSGKRKCFQLLEISKS